MRESEAERHESKPGAAMRASFVVGRGSSLNNVSGTMIAASFAYISTLMPPSGCPTLPRSSPCESARRSAERADFAQRSRAAFDAIAVSARDFRRAKVRHDVCNLECRLNLLHSPP